MPVSSLCRQFQSVDGPAKTSTSSAAGIFDYIELLPHEVIERVSRSLEYSVAKGIDILQSGSFWTDPSRTLKIPDRRRLLKGVLSDQATSAAKKIIFNGAEIDDLDFKWISEHFSELTHISLASCHSISDRGIISLLMRHGASIRHLDLTANPALTNSTLNAIGLYCKNLRRLILDRCSFSIAGISALIDGCGASIRDLSLSRCHLIDTSQLIAHINRQKTPRLRSLSLAHLDSLQPYQARSIAAECSRTLRSMNITGCPEILLKNVREILDAASASSAPEETSNHESLAPRGRLSLRHDAVLEDHSIDSIRRYLLGLLSVNR
jgi:hypothetical protein